MIEIKRIGKNIFPGLKKENLVLSYLGDGIYYEDGSWEGWHQAPGLGTNCAASRWGYFYLIGGKSYILAMEIEHVTPSYYQSSIYDLSYYRYGNYYSILSAGPHDLNGYYEFEFTPSYTGWYQLRIQMYYSHGRISTLGIFEKDDYVEFEKYREQKKTFDAKLFNVHGTTDILYTNGLILKRTGFREILGKDSDWATVETGTVTADDGSVWGYIKFDTYYINCQRNTEHIFINYNGEPVKLKTVVTASDKITYLTSTTPGQRSTFMVKVKLGSDSIAGWADTYTPTEDDWKRFFNGWKYSDGTTWNGIGSSSTADATTSLNNTVLDIDANANWHPITFIYKLGYKEDVDPTDGPFRGDPYEEYQSVTTTGDDLILLNGVNYIEAQNSAMKIMKGQKITGNDLIGGV